MSRNSHDSVVGLAFVLFVFVMALFVGSSWMFWGAVAKEQKCQRSCYAQGYPKGSPSGDQCFCMNDRTSVENKKDWNK